MLFSEANRIARESGESETEVIVKTFSSLEGIGDNFFVSRTLADIEAVQNDMAIIIMGLTTFFIVRPHSSFFVEKKWSGPIAI